MPLPGTDAAWSDRLLDALYAVAARFLVIVGLLVLVAPVIVVVLISVGSSTLKFPPTSWGLEAYGEIPSYMFDAFWTSVRIAGSAVLVSLAMTIPLSVALVRGAIPGRSILEAWFRSPVQVPALVLGVALYQYFIFLGKAGLSLRGSVTGLVIGHVVIITPFLLSSCVGRLNAMDATIEHAAYGLGAGFWRVTWEIILPLMKPGLVAGSFLAFLVSFNDVALSVFLVSPGTNTLPVTMLADAEQTLAPYLYAIATLVVVMSLVVCLLIDRFVGLRTVLGGDHS